MSAPTGNSHAWQEGHADSVLVLCRHMMLWLVESTACQDKIIDIALQIYDKFLRRV
jgi:hypothetical protein